jgi:hypothetical protein
LFAIQMHRNIYSHHFNKKQQRCTSTPIAAHTHFTGRLKETNSGDSLHCTYLPKISIPSEWINKVNNMQFKFTSRDSKADTPRTPESTLSGPQPTSIRTVYVLLFWSSPYTTLSIKKLYIYIHIYNWIERYAALKLLFVSSSSSFSLCIVHYLHSTI